MSKASKKLDKLAAETKLVAETTPDRNGRRELRLMSIKYRRLAEFARTQAERRSSCGARLADRS
jgi:hypothetical protein